MKEKFKKSKKLRINLVRRQRVNIQKRSHILISVPSTDQAVMNWGSVCRDAAM